VVVALTGCVPIGWVNPPGTVSVGGTARAFVAEPAAAPVAPAPGTETPAPETSGVTVRLGVHPLGLVETWLDREFDLSLGWSFEPALVQQGLQGPDFVVAWYPVHGALSEKWIGRLAVTGRARLLFAGDVESGYGCSLGASAEMVSFASGGFAEGESSGGDALFVTGAAQGEGGFGLYAEAGYADAGPFSWLDMQAGIYVRLPMSGGLGLFCCLELS
jgi:hypothetical protein